MMSWNSRAARRGLVRATMVVAALVVSGLCWDAQVRGAVVVPLQYNNSDNAAISFGATTYGPPTPGVPTWIPNNVSGQVDILSSPGGTFLTANPVTSNNVAEIGPVAIPNGNSLFLNWTGGTSGDGSPFGTGAATIYGPAATFGLTDATGGGGGTASYGIESWNSNWTINGPFMGTLGTYLSIGGNVPLTGSAAVAGMMSEIYVNGNIGAPDYTLSEVLAISNQGGGVYSYVALGSFAGSDPNTTGATFSGILANSLTNDFQGLSTSMVNVDFGGATTDLKVTTTITFYADPASINPIAPDLSLIPGGFLPDLVVGSSAVPEPGSIIMGSTALVALSALRWMRRRACRAAA